MNLADFYYKTAEKKGIETAEVWYLQVLRSRIRTVGPDEGITRQAALWKIRRRKLSLADCFALATREASAEVIMTTDPILKEAAGKTGVYIGSVQSTGLG